MRNVAAFVVILAFGIVAHAQQKDTQSPAEQCEMMKRGDHAMGFAQEKTTHHFQLFKDGGAIAVDANDAKDTESRDQIRMHLSHIAKMFWDGDFNVPMFIHDTTPPGVPTMSRLRGQIQYEFQQTASGGMVRITTKYAEALDAVHAFLLFQIIDHRTGDSPDITNAGRR